MPFVKNSREMLGLVLLLILGLGLRLAFVHRFPTIPYSDFLQLVSFGRFLHDHGIFSNSWFWEYFNPGMPLALSVLFHIFPGDTDHLARLATVVICGLLPILPFLIWRNVLPFWLRLLAGTALALWPGQIMFSGVVAQDNWVLLPVVALGSLAVRSLAGGSRAPIAAGLLLAAGTAMRQEMLVALLPLFVAAAGFRFRAGWRPITAAVLAAVLPLAALAAYRGITTGRYTLSTEHSGLAVLGAYIPGAAADGWTDPYPFIASVRPDLLHNRQALLSQASQLAFQEALRRPKFQLVRILQQMWTGVVAGESLSVYWSLRAPEALPPALHAGGEALAQDMAALLRYEMAGIQGLFLAALLIGIARRSMPILVLASAVLLKLAIHAAVASQGRYFFPATALEILAIALALYEIRKAPGQRLLLGLAVGSGMIFSLVLLDFRLPLELYVLHHDTDSQRTYRFPMEVLDHRAELDCDMNHGLLTALSLPRFAQQSATIRTMQVDPPPGDSATAVCELTGHGEPRPLTLQVLDPYAPGGFPNRMLQRVEIDGVEVFSHDLAKEPGSGWANIPLGDVGAGTKHKVVVEVKALQPDPGPAWGAAAATTFQLARE